MSINNRLTIFAQEELVLGRSAEERNKIDTSLNRLQQVLKGNLNKRIKSFLRFGSYTRNTILPRKYDRNSDVDLMVIFDTSENSYTVATYRRWLHNVIDKAYPNSISKKDFPAVRLLLNHIMFDLVPAKSDTDFFGRTFYYIPGDNGNWTQTYPNDLNSDLTSVNQSLGNNVARNVIRLMKHWNAGAGYPYQSYLMGKEIVRTMNTHIIFPISNTTYDLFLEVLERIAGSRAGVKQALDMIKHYQGNIWRVPDPEKELQWVKKLLPGLN